MAKKIKAAKKAQELPQAPEYSSYGRGEQFLDGLLKDLRAELQGQLPNPFAQ